MLGRYVTGTVLILGVAMVSAPDRAEVNAPEEAEVTRAEAAPFVLAATDEQPAAFTQKPAAFTAPRTGSIAAPAPAALSEADTARIDAALSTIVEPQETDPQPPAIGGIAALAGLEPAPTVTPVVSAPAPIRPEYLYVTGTRVNVRSGPSTQFQVISRVVYGDSVEMVSTADDGWAEVRILGTDTVGYMSADYLAPQL